MELYKSASKTGAIALKSILGTLLLSGLLAGLAPSAQATLIGQTVGCSITSPTPNIGCSTETAVVQTTAAEFVVNVGRAGLWDIDIGPNSIDIGLNFGRTQLSEVIDVTLTDLFWLGNPDAVITGFLLSVSGVTGLTDGDISFTDNSLGFDLGSDADWGLRSSATITLITEDRGSSVSVPEPATLALFGLGLAGLGFARRRTTA